jgi:hypothetical protein
MRVECKLSEKCDRKHCTHYTEHTKMGGCNYLCTHSPLDLGLGAVRCTEVKATVKRPVGRPRKVDGFVQLALDKLKEITHDRAIEEKAYKQAAICTIAKINKTLFSQPIHHALEELKVYCKYLRDEYDLTDKDIRDYWREHEHKRNPH